MKFKIKTKIYKDKDFLGKKFKIIYYVPYIKILFFWHKLDRWFGNHQKGLGYTTSRIIINDRKIDLITNIKDAKKYIFQAKEEIKKGLKIAKIGDYPVAPYFE